MVPQRLLVLIIISPCLPLQNTQSKCRVTSEWIKCNPTCCSGNGWGGRVGGIGETEDIHNLGDSERQRSVFPCILYGTSPSNSAKRLWGFSMASRTEEGVLVGPKIENCVPWAGGIWEGQKQPQGREQRLAGTGWGRVGGMKGAGVCQVCSAKGRCWGQQEPSRCGKEKSLHGRNLCKSASLHSASVQQCLLTRQGGARGAPGVPPPHLALQKSLPQLLVFALAVPGGPRGAGRPSALSTLRCSRKERRVLCAWGCSPALGTPNRDAGWQQDHATS